MFKLPVPTGTIMQLVVNVEWSDVCQMASLCSSAWIANGSIVVPIGIKMSSAIAVSVV